MKVAFRSLLLLLLQVVLVQCEEEEVSPREYPRLRTLEVSEISEQGAQFNAEFVYRGDYEILRYGFIWGGTLRDPSLENAVNIINSTNLQADTYSEFIDIGLEANRVYLVRAFVETETFVVFGERVQFRSKGSGGPELIDFPPKSGNLNDTISLNATSFGTNRFNVRVNIGQKAAEIVDFEETEIRVVIPESLSTESSSVSVKVTSGTSTFDEPFNLLKPVIDNISPREVTFGSTITVTGANFIPDPDRISLKFIGSDGREYPSEILSVTENSIETTIPADVASKELSIAIAMNNLETIGDQKLTMADPEIISITESAKSGSEMTITGANFSPVLSDNAVFVDGQRSVVISASKEELVVRLPDQSDHIYSGRQVQVRLTILSTEVQAPNLLVLTDKWFRLNDLPFDEFVWNGLSNNGTGYVLYNGGFWNYDPVVGRWTQLSAFPDPDRSGPGIFSISDKIYLSGGSSGSINNLKDFWEYDIPSNTWTQKGDFPGPARKYPLGFSVGTDGYLGMGLDNNPNSCCSGFSDMWKFDALTDGWSQVAGHPDPGGNGLWNLVSTNLNNEVYVGLGNNSIFGPNNNEVFKYNVVNNQWVQIENYPSTSQNSHIFGIAFTVGNRAYLGSGTASNNLWSYDGFSWLREEPIELGVNGGFSFVIDDIAYIGGGEFNNEFWTFDPTQPD